MSEHDNPTGSISTLKQKLMEALQTSVSESSDRTSARIEQEKHIHRENTTVELNAEDRVLPDGKSVYSLLSEEEDTESSLTLELQESSARLTAALQQTEREQKSFQGQDRKKTEFDDTLSKRGVVPDVQTEIHHPAGVPSSSSHKPQNKSNSVNSGGSMADLSGYKDLSKAPISFGDDDMPMSTITSDLGYERERAHATTQHAHHQHQPLTAAQHFAQQDIAGGQEVDTEFSGNVKTLIRLVNELPEGVTKQTGAQIIRLTMEAMGISMEDVLSEAQSAQSEMLDAVRANIKKIEEYKTVIRKLETDIKYYQGKANELSEIIDLFILSNTSGNKMAMPEDLSH